MEHYYDRVPLFVFPEIYTKNSGISPRELFYTYFMIRENLQFHFSRKTYSTYKGKGKLNNKKYRFHSKEGNLMDFEVLFQFAVRLL